MESKEIRQNIRLGIFVTGGIVLFLFATFYLGRENNLFTKTFTISAVFRNVEGLNEGDNVWLSGVKIGTVKRVKIMSEGRVVVDLTLKDKQNEFIKTDATAFVGSDGFVGNKIVVIRPGTAAHAIEHNDTINALSPTDTQELINLAKDVGATTRSITDDLKLISARLNSGEGLFGELLHDGPVAKDIRNVITSLKQTGQSATRVTEKANQTLAEINNGGGLVNRLLTDTAYAQAFEVTLKNLEQAGENSKRISEELRQVTAQIHEGNNAVSILLTDSTFARQLKGTLDNARAASSKLDQNMEALQHNFLLRGYFRKQKKREEKEKI